ncbi:MAG: hypothetical protein V1821_00905 [bacterium]
MNERQESIFRMIAEEYIKTALPVGSVFLSKGKALDVSPATIRKEMVSLEDMGYLTHPHTSAGRLPTEKGYRYLLEHFVQEKSAAPEIIKKMSEELRAATDEDEVILKRLAKFLAEMSKETVILGFGPNDVFYTGVSNLFQKPEFGEAARLVNLSGVVDHFDEIVSRIFESVRGIEVKIGSENPWGLECSAVITKVQYKKREILLVLLGPTRMNYERNLNLVKQIKETLEAV